MTQIKNFALAAMLSLSVIFTGCSKPPVEQIDATAAALTSADGAEADQYVADLYQAAQDSFAAAQVEIEAQNAKSSFSRSYDRAESLLKFAHETATEAEAFVDIRKEELRAENEALFTRVDSTIMSAQTLMQSAPRGKDGAVALASIQDDLVIVQQTLAGARTAQLEGNFVEARDMANLALEEVGNLVFELETAISRTNPPVRS